MRILAASFLTEASATAALETLGRRFGPEESIRIAPLGPSTGASGGSRPTTVLAGRFGEDVIAAVRKSVGELGGTVVVDVDEGAIGNA